MDATKAGDDIRYIREVLERTRRRIDPHAFHFVHWGFIVLLWYPAMNLLALRGERREARVRRMAREADGGGAGE